MSNDLTKSIKYVDTAAVVYADSVPLGVVVWTNQTATGDDLILSDADGVILLKVKASCAADYIEFDFNGAPHTLTVTTIDTGVLLIHPYLP